MEDERKINLQDCYKHIYICETPGCTNTYGSDKEEKGEHICPVCEGKVR